MSSCISVLGPGPPPPLACNDDHCVAFQYSPSFHSICLCRDWQNNIIPGCNPEGSNYPVQTGQCVNLNDPTQIKNISSDDCYALGPPWRFQQCYCCCTCFASSTPVESSNGFRALGDYVVDDEVLAAAKSGTAWAWSPQKVQFSSGSPPAAGTGPTAGTIMLYIEYGDSQSFVTSTNQLFVMPGGKLKLADQLVPGTDNFVGKDGDTIPIHRIASGYYKGAIHHIATDVPTYAEWDGSIDNHLLNVNGITSGDYLLQLFQNTPKMQPNMAPEGPVIGTHAYKAAAKHLSIKPFVVGASLEKAGTEVASPGFRAHAESRTHIPDGAIQLFSDDQEAYLIDPDIPKRGFSDQTNVLLTEYYIKLYGGFYPDVRIVLDWESIHPNIFAFEEYGQPVVIVCGEFLRLGPLYAPAVAIGIAFGIAGTSNGITCGQALFTGIGEVTNAALQGGTTWMDTMQPGQQQFNTLLDLLAKKDPNAEDGQLSAACLKSVIDAAISGEQLPACAGGPPATP